MSRIRFNGENVVGLGGQGVKFATDRFLIHMLWVTVGNMRNFNSRRGRRGTRAKMRQKQGDDWRPTFEQLEWVPENFH